jgi:hypothetical protein
MMGGGLHIAAILSVVENVEIISIHASGLGLLCK